MGLGAPVSSRWGAGVPRAKAFSRELLCLPTQSKGEALRRGPVTGTCLLGVSAPPRLAKVKEELGFASPGLRLAPWLPYRWEARTR